MTNTSTYKGISVALGVGLAILWIAGLSSPYAPVWLTWLDGVGALCAFMIGGANKPADLRNRRMTGPVLLSVGIFALWIIALATKTVGWMTWWNFAFACAFLFFGVSAGGSKSLPDIRDQRDADVIDVTPRDRFKKTG